MRPVCIPCMAFYRPMQNGAVIEAGDQLWAGDLYQCPECGVQMLTGFSREPLAASWQGLKYDELRERSLGRVTP